jgi:hypothetical protein
MAQYIAHYHNSPKILKEFEDPQFAEYQYRFEKIIPQWFWGLGDDGELYCKCSRWHSLEGWYKLSGVTLNIYDMRRILDKFEPYLKLKAFW